MQYMLQQSYGFVRNTHKWVSYIVRVFSKGNITSEVSELSLRQLNSRPNVILCQPNNQVAFSHNALRDRTSPANDVIMLPCY